MGGNSVANVSRKIDYLIIGSIGSEAWIHTNYGRKIQKAVTLRDEGHDIEIMPEDAWASALIE